MLDAAAACFSLFPFMLNLSETLLLSKQGHLFPLDLGGGSSSNISIETRGDFFLVGLSSGQGNELTTYQKTVHLSGISLKFFFKKTLVQNCASQKMAFSNVRNASIVRIFLPIITFEA